MTSPVSVLCGECLLVLAVTRFLLLPALALCVMTPCCSNLWPPLRNPLRPVEREGEYDLFFVCFFSHNNKTEPSDDEARPSFILPTFRHSEHKCSVSTGSLFGSVIRRDTCCFQMNANVSAWKQFSAVWLIRSKQLKQTKYKNSSWSKCNCWSLNCFIVLFFFSFLSSVQFYYKAKSTQT